MSEENLNPTIEEQRELLETIKFPPRKYKIEITGRGGEIVVGSVSAEAYDYLSDNEIDIEELIDDEDNDLEVPKELLFIQDGAWYDCDNIAHENGATMDDMSTISVYDETGKEIWSHSLDIDSLENIDINVDEIDEIYTNERDDIDAVFIGQSVEKGLFFGGDFIIKSEFDPTKLKFEYSDIEGWYLFSSIQYDGEYIDNYEYDTSGKGSQFDLIDLRKNKS